MFKGTLVALVTPFLDNLNKSVDYESLEKILEYQMYSKYNPLQGNLNEQNIYSNKLVNNKQELNINKIESNKSIYFNKTSIENTTDIKSNYKPNIDGLLICASTGEGTLLTNEERIDIINFVIKSVNNKIPVIVGCSSCSTPEAVRNAKIASDLGSNGVLVTAPYYVKPNQEGIFKHFEKVSNNTNIPIIVYNIPSRVSVNIELDTLRKIFELPNVVAIKDSTKNFETLSILHKEFPSINILSGDDGTLPACLAHGACGAISAAANIYPLEISNIINSWNNNDLITFKKLSQIVPYISKVISVTTNPIPIKYILSKMNLIKNIVREPLCNVNNDQMKLIDGLLNIISNLTQN